jgi:hypothetical protein
MNGKKLVWKLYGKDSIGEIQNRKYGYTGGM